MLHGTSSGGSITDDSHVLQAASDANTVIARLDVGGHISDGLQPRGALPAASRGVGLALGLNIAAGSPGYAGAVGRSGSLSQGMHNLSHGRTEWSLSHHIARAGVSYRGSSLKRDEVLASCKPPCRHAHLLTVQTGTEGGKPARNAAMRHSLARLLEGARQLPTQMSSTSCATHSSAYAA